MMNRDRYLHILRYLHFTDNRNEPDRADENFDRLWKIRDLFEILNDTFSKFYDPSENLAIDVVIVPFNGRVIFKQYIPKKSKRFDIKMFKLCDSTGYTYDMKVSVPGEGQTAHSTARDSNPYDSDRTDEEDRRTWPQIIPGQFLSSPELFDDLVKKQIYCCGTGNWQLRCRDCKARGVTKRVLEVP